MYVNLSAPPLSIAQRAEIELAVEKAGIDAAAVRFVQVPLSNETAYIAYAFLQPTTTAHRVGRGRFFRFHNSAFGSKPPRHLSELGRARPDEEEYVYVTSNPQLSATAPVGRPPPPPRPETPFRPPAGIPDTELPALIDAVRAAVRDRAGSLMPVHRIQVDEKDGAVNVYLLRMSHRPGAGGLYVTLKRVAQRFEVTGVGQWVS